MPASMRLSYFFLLSLLYNVNQGYADVGRRWDGAALPPVATFVSRRRSRPTSTVGSASAPPLSFFDDNLELDNNLRETKPCISSVAKNLFRGAYLRVASDLLGGTPLESIKTRVTITKEGPFEATRNILREGGPKALWAGTPSRTIEGSLIGGLFVVGSVATKAQLKKMGAPPTVAALIAGIVGGVMQSLVMTPAGMIFTALHANRGKPGHEKENALSVTRKILKEKGIAGLYRGNTAMVMRQASNWASRSGFTELARTTFGFSKYGLLGELGAGCFGGVGSCWNTPIETIRVVLQRDISMGKRGKSMREYWDQIYADEGLPGLFRGVTPRAVQAIWQTVFLVVVPNLMGI